jgi:F-type H+-transporting ATPase subunit epsilon
MSKLQLTIATPSRKIYSDEVEQITLTTTSGEITILPKHVPIISHLETGHVMVKKDGKETYFAIDGGILEVRHDNSVIVLSDKSERADEIDIERAEEAAKKAAEYMKNPEETGFDYTKLQAMMKREENRARIARKGHRK